MSLQVVWYKRDLRVLDHEPLVRAAERGPVLPLYIFEPELWGQPDASATHYEFLRGSIAELRETLGKLGQPLVVRVGDAVQILDDIHSRFGIGHLWSHEETGNGWSYARDRSVRAWARSREIPFYEAPNNGVVRRLKSRDEWAGIREQRMQQPIFGAPTSLRPCGVETIGEIPTRQELGIETPPASHLQMPGEIEAHKTLDHFLTDRVRFYRSSISSPLSAWSHCSRLSPYLTYGSLSSRVVAQATDRRLAQVTQLGDGPDNSNLVKDIEAFRSRLWWRCHFMQKLEDEPSIEFQNMNRVFDNLREADCDAVRLEAWKSGQTGYPLVDACMRALHQTGWINFRMRAMLASFAAYHLWLHWREPSLHLARLFVDYEPGIHYSQFQMQSGVTGINTIRVYSPTKQAEEQDPSGRFIRSWVPELANVPTGYVHAPWRLPRERQVEFGCIVGIDYPAPIVSHEEAIRWAREKLTEVRRSPEYAEERERVRTKHGSRRRTGASARPPKVVDRSQLALEI